MTGPSTRGLDGLRLTRLGDEPGAAHEAARSFCLAVIAEFYGFPYRPDWHADLDSLTRPAAANHYSGPSRGAFWTVTEPDGALVATAGIQALTFKPAMVEAFAGRYPDPARVAFLSRVYVRADRRGRGLGRALDALAVREAPPRGYERLYLHATDNAAATLGFWRSAGYAEIGAFLDSIHFDKPLAATTAEETR